MLIAMMRDNISLFFLVMDETTARGLPSEQVARTVVHAVETHNPEVLPAPLIHKIAVMIRPLLPQLLFWIMSRRAKKQSQASEMKRD